MDTDALVKLTKAGAKGVVAKAHEVLIAPAVAKEAIEAGKVGGHGDALLIEQNVRAGRVALRSGRRVAAAERMLETLRLQGGEADALRLYLSARADIVVSDDFAFLRVLRSIQVPFATPSALLAHLVHEKAIRPEEGLRLLHQMARQISDEEFYLARADMEAE